MNKVIAFVKSQMPTIHKAIVAFVVPNIPAVVALVEQNYGVAAGAELVAVLTALGVYKATNTPAKVPTPVPAPTTAP